MSCARESQARSRKRNDTEDKQERRRETTRQWQRRNHTHRVTYNREYRSKHPEVRRHERAIERAVRRAQKPAWADNAAIHAVYAEARRLEAEIGESYHIDHVIPLRGENVCGLHVAENLQILRSDENQRKGNSF